jgi:hypothetical protein
VQLVADPRRWTNAFNALDEIMNLGPDWDSHGADPISPLVCARVQMILEFLYDSGWTAPSVVPSSQGTIQLEWHEGGIDEEWEIYVEPQLSQ